MRTIITIITSLVAILFITMGFFTVAQAGIIDNLKYKISTHADSVNQLEDEIKETTRMINNVQAESRTLSSSIRTLDLTRDKLLTDIKITQNKIDSAELTIEKIQYEVLQTQQAINTDNARIINLLQIINETGNQSLVEAVLTNDELTQFWHDVESMQRVRNMIRNNLKQLENLKVDLQDKEKGKQKERSELAQLDDKYADQKKIVDANKWQKTKLLTQTKNKESNYKKILLNKIVAKEAFERELMEYQAQLNILIDRDKLPSREKGVLGWPLPDISTDACSSKNKHKNCTTQYFGDTPFARSGAYDGRGHNGMDFRAAVGTPIYSTESGTIEDIGNTDKYPGCYSYGKWVLITHDNGLSSLYAHLSLIKVNSGQYVRRGDLIGYSGNTGFSTGPHLHFTVFATEGVSVVKLGDIKKITNCGQAHIPVASLNAFMNPLDYL